MLEDIPVLDAHAHPLLEHPPRGADAYRACFSEAHVPTHVERTLLYRRSIRDLAPLLHCDADEVSVLAAREALDDLAWAERCFRAARIDAALLDDGFLRDQTRSLEWHARLTDVRRVLRLEAVAEGLLFEASSFGDFRERFRHALSGDPRVVALKTIAAYRCGLDIAPPDAAVAEARFHVLRAQHETRLVDRAWIDFLIGEALDATDLPLQIHAGFGDPDLDLLKANPLLLRRLVESRPHARLVILHAAWPYAREASWMASVYPSVHLDFGLAVPFLSVAAMRATLTEVLSLAPWTSLCYSSDASRIPELFFLGAKWGRRVLEDVLQEAVRDGDLDGDEARSAGKAILRGNALRLYGVGEDASSSTISG